MNDAIARLEPRSVWEHFARITTVPRPSKHEEKMADHVRSIAQEHGFEVLSDEIGNLVLRVPASPGRESAPAVIIQGHLDMVCEKNKGVEHDFMNDAIDAQVDGDWVAAVGTTLGSDNGIGVAAALAAATDPAVEHGPLELLFTLDEETGLTGAQQLDGKILTGGTMLNLDSEEDGVIFVGCAGGADTQLALEVERDEPAAGSSPFLLEVSGLRGGHSGLNIHENRGNAIKILTRLLFDAVQQKIPFQLASLKGGTAHNAIPREAEAIVQLDPAAAEQLRGLLERQRTALATEVAGVDEGLEIRLSDGAESDPPLTTDCRDRLLRLLMTVPHGVLGMSPAIPGLVETSNNLAMVERQAGAFGVVASSRSSVMSTMAGVLATIRAAGEAVGAEVETHGGYPGWQPNLDSPVLAVVRDVYRELWGGEPNVTAIHAGLECGLLGEKVPGLDMVSFGPQIEGAHSPEERVQVSSVARFWDALKQTLARLSAPA